MSDQQPQLPKGMVEAIHAAIEAQKVMMAQVEATKDRTGKEAFAIASQMLDASVEVLERDQNVQSIVFTSVPYGCNDNGTPIAGGSQVGLASKLACAVSVNTAKAFMYGHVPSLAREFIPSFWGRLKLAYYVLRGKSNLPQVKGNPVDMFANDQQGSSMRRVP